VIVFGRASDRLRTPKGTAPKAAGAVVVSPRVARPEKILEQVLGGRSDANVGFEDLRNLLIHLGFRERTRGSHRIVRREWNRRDDQPPTRIVCRSELIVENRYEIIIFWSDDDRAFLADVPELAGCMAHGSTHEEALRNAQEAIQLWLETAEEDGRAIPQPKGRRLVYA
jgi:predicted RNase H-like HicB family nuclease